MARRKISEEYIKSVLEDNLYLFPVVSVKRAFDRVALGDGWDAVSFGKLSIRVDARKKIMDIMDGIFEDFVRAVLERVQKDGRFEVTLDDVEKVIETF